MKLNNSKLKFIIKTLISLGFFIFASLATSCETTEPPPSNQKLTLTAEDASCTEVWLNLKLQNVSLPTTIKITEGDSTFLSTSINSNDTTLFIENLLPGQTYNFQATGIKDQVSSIKVPVTTMDTTSHNFTWQTFTFGGANGSSILKDVAIINENNIWAVGEIHTAETDQFDSNGVWVQPYNAVHWDGNTWELKRILYKNGFWDINTIFAFNENDIWFDAYMHWNGERFVTLEIPDVLTGWGINATWGTSSKDFYVVGNGGNIAHYNGSSWRKIESGTETQIRDVWGYVDKMTGKQKVLCAVSNVITLGDYKILEIRKDNKVYEISWNTGDLDKRVNSIWFNNNYQIFTCGGGVFISKEDGLWEKQPLPSIHTNKIRGVDRNDIIVAGDFGLVAHFNGVSWKVYETENVALFYSLDYKKNILTAVGERNAKGVLLMMRKQ